MTTRIQLDSHFSQDQVGVFLKHLSPSWSTESIVAQSPPLCLLWVFAGTSLGRTGLHPLISWFAERSRIARAGGRSWESRVLGASLHLGTQVAHSGEWGAFEGLKKGPILI